MLFFTFTLACLSLVSGRTFRPRLPGGLSHSIVNLGKMDFNVYLNSKPAELPKNEYGMAHSSKPFRNSKYEPVGCPCQQNVRKIKNQDPQDPHDILINFLTGIGPSPFKESMSSVMCCSSEETQEELILELKSPAQPFPPMRQIFPPIPQRFPSRSPRFSKIQPQFPPIPSHFPPMLHNVPPLTIFPLGDMLPKNVHLSGAGTIILDELIGDKTNNNMPELKKIEILVEPTRKTKATRPTTTSPATTPDIKVVGDKKTTMLYDLMGTNLSVKKDLTQDIGRFKDVETLPKTTGTFNHSNTL